MWPVLQIALRGARLGALSSVKLSPSNFAGRLSGLYALSDICARGCDEPSVFVPSCLQSGPLGSFAGCPRPRGFGTLDCLGLDGFFQSRSKIIVRFCVIVPCSFRSGDSRLPLGRFSRAADLPLMCRSRAARAPLTCRSSAGHVPLSRSRPDRNDDEHSLYEYALALSWADHVAQDRCSPNHLPTHRRTVEPGIGPRASCRSSKLRRSA